jgi:hypothetical protein
VDVYVQLGQLAGVTSAGASVQQTALGRGLVAGSSAARQALLAVPTSNSLIIADNPLDGISIFSDRHLASWQQQHGALPEELVDFLQGKYNPSKQQSMSAERPIKQMPANCLVIA